MATCAENKATANTYIISLYPEILIVDPNGGSPIVTTSITETMDVLATLGRLSYTITLTDEDHGPALEEYLTTALGSTGYTAKHKSGTVVISCG